MLSQTATDITATCTIVLGYMLDIAWVPPEQQQLQQPCGSGGCRSSNGSSSLAGCLDGSSSSSLISRCSLSLVAARNVRGATQLGSTWRLPAHSPSLQLGGTSTTLRSRHGMGWS
jgi:hypothetical protein